MRPLMSLLLLGLPWPTAAEDRELATMRKLLSPMRDQKDVSLDTRGSSALVTSVKHQLRDWVEPRMSKARGRRDLGALEIRLNDELREAKLSCALDYEPNENACPEMNALGYVGAVRLESREYGNMAILRTSVGILCGSDESAYAYQWSDDRWVRFWQTEQNDYGPGKYSPQTLEGVYISEMSQNLGQRLILTTGTSVLS